MCCKSSYPECDNVFDELQTVCPAIHTHGHTYTPHYEPLYITDPVHGSIHCLTQQIWEAFVKLNRWQFWLIHHTSTHLTSSLTNSYIIHYDTQAMGILAYDRFHFD
jgi:hypothetical protein